MPTFMEQCNARSAIQTRSISTASASRRAASGIGLWFNLSSSLIRASVLLGLRWGFDSLLVPVFLLYLVSLVVEFFLSAAFIHPLLLLRSALIPITLRICVDDVSTV